MSLLPPERHERILGMLRRDRTVSVHGLAEQLTVTRETIRRDLDQLEAAGRLKRIHGGAVASTAPSGTEHTLQQRMSEHTAQKQAIARAALRLLPPSAGGSLIIDSGTTTEALADLLSTSAPEDEAGGQRVLITNSVPIAHKLSGTGVADVEILGGSVRQITGAAVGQQTISSLSRRRADVAFIGTNGIDAAFGLSTPDTQEAEVKTALIRAARTRVVLADASKLGRCSLVQFAGLKDIDVLITDAPPSRPLAQALTEAGVSVVEAAQ